ncbi:uncharacterized protein K452DRAFT_287831 [Aplosporella prunicola CBS 121167]|uniref:Uncharacterized protein n=1 Tax=Aplosporella prunicola CBS 121167 TaxID=1176127 RepID=A0A6A6BEA7_9PEZI|nr:uncharacterized protein K452DRAFT_287831 [Aplosporella prunicola CBS 121167]KAF2141858.1 hypothetical protein K452DRAFT_287831 [Aplosporella prunicola CBS 121167]
MALSRSLMLSRRQTDGLEDVLGLTIAMAPACPRPAALRGPCWRVVAREDGAGRHPCARLAYLPTLSLSLSAFLFYPYKLVVCSLSLSRLSSPPVVQPSRLPVAGIYRSPYLHTYTYLPPALPTRLLADGWTAAAAAAAPAPVHSSAFHIYLP